MAVRTRIVGNRDLGGRFARLVGRRRQAARAFARNHAEDVAARWAGATRSSRLADAITVREVQPGHYVVEATSAAVGFDPALVEYDTQPHTIAPAQEHGLLVFEKDGRTEFVKGSVNHPGTTGDHALRSAVEQGRSAYREGLKRIWSGA